MNTYLCSISDITLRNEMIPFQRDHDLTTLEKKWDSLSLDVGSERREPIVGVA